MLFGPRSKATIWGMLSAFISPAPFVLTNPQNSTAEQRCMGQQMDPQSIFCLISLLDWHVKPPEVATEVTFVYTVALQMQCAWCKLLE